MELERLESTLTEMIKEQQMKLGYEKETVRFYFQETSMDAFLGLPYSTDWTDAQISSLQEKMRKQAGGTLGELVITKKGNRFCVTIPPEGSAYVHQHVKENPFLREMIQLFQCHHVELAEVQALFERYGAYRCEKADGLEFDYLFYFLTPDVDTWFYCLKFDAGHASYHRFTKEDLETVL